MKPTMLAGRLSIAIATAMFALALIGGASAEEDAPFEPAEKSWTVLPHEPVQAKRAPPLTEEASCRIRELLKALAAIESPQLALTASSGGGPYFSPIGHRVYRNGFGVKNLERFEDSSAMAELVALGPASLPALLEGLSDSTLTQLTFEHPGGFGAMWYATELPVHPMAEREMAALSTAFPEGGLSRGWWDNPTWPVEEEYTEAHKVAVGDVCFATLGQIVNRPYQAVRHQGSACIVVSSPLHEPRLRTALLSMWGGDDPRESLLQSLVQDFHTRGEESESLQQGAGVRLLTYFPTESAELVRARFDGLVLDEPDWRKRWTANGHVNAGEFLATLLKTRHPAVAEAWLRFLGPSTVPDVLRSALEVPKEIISEEAQKRLVRLLSTTVDQEVFLALLALVPGQADDKALARLESFLETPYVKYSGSRVNQTALHAVLDLYPEEAERVYRGHVARHGMLGRVDMLLALDRHSEQLPAFAIRLLTKFTASQDQIPDWRIQLSRGGAPMRRVRDWAAVMLAEKIEGLEFDPRVDEKGRDRQIEVMRQALDGLNEGASADQADR